MIDSWFCKRTKLSWYFLGKRTYESDRQDFAEIGNLSVQFEDVVPIRVEEV